jgi:uncharacterized protein (DUF488 family)
MEKELANHNIKYLHIEKLGGRQNGKRIDGNAISEKMRETYNNYAWENKSFRAYADYMCNLEFKDGVEELLSLYKQEDKKKKYNNNNIAIMCAEALPWRCHRRLVSDYLVAIENVEVYDIMNISSTSLHRLTSFAYMENGMLIYPSNKE